MFGRELLTLCYQKNNCIMDKFFLRACAVACLMMFSAFSLYSCGGEDEPGPDPTKKTGKDLQAISITSSENEGLAENSIGVISGNLVYLTVPDNVAGQKLVPTISISEGAVAAIDGVTLEKGMAVDLLDAQNLVVTAEDGSTKTYAMLVKTGNPKMDALVYKFMNDYSIPAIALTICKDEEVVYSCGYGFGDGTARDRATDKHLFRLASLSKQFTSAAIMKLVEEGRLSLSSRVFGKGGVLEEEFGADITGLPAAVTVQDLLQHASGWISDPEDPMFPGLSNSPYWGMTTKERIDYVLHNVAQTSTPGQSYSYYNLGYGMLGMVIEKVSGMDYESYLKENIWGPAGISDMHVGGDLAHRRENEVIYTSQDGGDGYANDMEMLKAAGGLIGSSSELARFLCSMDYGTKVPDILKPETLDLIYTPSRANNQYGLGWNLNHTIFTDWRGYHSGALAGTATMWSVGNNGVNGVLLCNSRSFTKPNFDTDMYVLLHDLEQFYKSSLFWLGWAFVILRMPGLVFARRIWVQFGKSDRKTDEKNLAVLQNQGKVATFATEFVETRVRLRSSVGRANDS